MSGRSIGSEKTVGGGGEHEIERPGARIGDRYDVVALIGRGGMGAVYRCRDLKLEREVAVKRLLAEGAAARAGLERFHGEAKAVAALNHSNIVVVHEYGDDARGPYLVMELLHGHDLATFVGERGALAVETVKEIARQVCTALAYAHRFRVIHRDIKPSNLFRLADGTIKVLDFGLARVGTESQLSIEGLGLGTLDYVSPEQRRDASRVDHRSDLFSLGATLYFLAVGKSPRTVKERDLPPELREVVLKLMEERPEERYFAVAEALAALERAPAPGAARAAARADDLCVSCGRANAPGTRFCEGCGTGLFDKCPACSAEGRAGRKFCGKCGASIPDHRKAQEHMARAKELETARAWARAEKEWSEALRLRADMPEAKDGIERARKSVVARDEARRRCERAIAERDVEGARAALGRLAKLAPEGDATVAELGVQRLAPLAQQWARLAAAQREAETGLDSGEWGECEAALERADAAWAGHATTAELRSRLAGARAALEQALGAAETALEARDLAAAERALEDLPERCGERAERVRARLAEARHREASARSLRAEAARLAASADWEQGAEKLDDANEIWCDERADKAVRRMLAGAKRRAQEAVEKKKQAEARALLEAASKSIESGAWDEAEQHLARADAFLPGAEVTAPLRGELAAARQRAREAIETRRRTEAGALRTEARAFVAEGRWDAVEPALEAAQAIWPDDAATEVVRGELLAAKARLDAAFARVREAVAAHDAAAIEAAERELAAASLGREAAADVASASEAIRDARTRKATADARAADASRRLAANDFAAALAACDEAQRAWPGHAGAAEAAHAVHKRQADLAHALERAETAFQRRDLVHARAAVLRAKALCAGDPRIEPLERALAEEERRQRTIRASVADGRAAAARLGSPAFSARDARRVLDGAAADPADAVLAEAATRVLASRVEACVADSSFDQAELVLATLEERYPAAPDVARLRAAIADARDGAERARADACERESMRARVDGWAEVLDFEPDPTLVDAAWLAPLRAARLPWRVRHRTTGIELVLVPPGTFDMGASPGDREARPDEVRRRVTISSAFYLGRAPVTQAEWTGVMGTSPSRCGSGERCPVETVSWDDVAGAGGFLERAGGSLRLPTEAEWEHACRAGSDAPRHGELALVAWYRGNSARATRPVQGKRANAFGLFDVLGNVWEWCADLYGEYERAGEPLVDPAGPPAGQFRVLRGGSWNDGRSECRASYRNYLAPKSRFGVVGFRVARTP